jgi:cupin 2 domain-containing protein
MTTIDNVFAGLPPKGDAEHFAILAEDGAVRIERIVSWGQATPPGLWLDQPRTEWVVVLEGSAGLQFAGESAPRVLTRGNHVLIPAHAQHRVAWTDPDGPTVWLAVHYG